MVTKIQTMFKLNCINKPVYVILKSNHVVVNPIPNSQTANLMTSTTGDMKNLLTTCDEREHSRHFSYLKLWRKTDNYLFKIKTDRLNGDPQN